MLLRMSSDAAVAPRRASDDSSTEAACAAARRQGAQQHGGAHPPFLAIMERQSSVMRFAPQALWRGGHSATATALDVHCHSMLHSHGSPREHSCSLITNAVLAGWVSRSGCHM